MKPERTTAPVPGYHGRKGGIECSAETDPNGLLTLNIIIEKRIFVAIEIKVFECAICREVLAKRENPPG